MGTKCACALSGAPSKAAEKREAESGRVQWMRRALPKGTTVFFVESGTNGKRVQLYIAPQKGEIEDITMPAASLSRIRTSADGKMIFSGYGYSAGQEAVEGLAMALWGSVKALKSRKV